MKTRCLPFQLSQISGAKWHRSMVKRCNFHHTCGALDWKRCHKKPMSVWFPLLHLQGVLHYLLLVLGGRQLRFSLGRRWYWKLLIRWPDLQPLLTEKWTGKWHSWPARSRAPATWSQAHSLLFDRRQHIPLRSWMIKPYSNRNMTNEACPGLIVWWRKVSETAGNACWARCSRIQTGPICLSWQQYCELLFIGAYLF